MTRELLAIADELRAVATTGLHFGESEYDRERYERLLGLAARLAERAGAGERELLEQVFRADQGYITPKLDVRLALFRGGDTGERVLLIREKQDGRWCLPGGYVDVGDSPSGAAVRETLEEARVEARVTRLVGVFDNRLRPEAPPHLFQIYKLVFLGELIDPSAEPRPGSEADAARFHDVAALPDLSLGRTLPRDIQHAMDAAHDRLPHTLYD